MPLDRTETLARARKLAPVLRARAAEGEKLRRMPDNTVADLIDSGLLGLLRPARFGGSELTWEVLCEASIELAQGDGSQAWVANVYGHHPMFAALFEDEAQHDLWDADPDALISASIIPPRNKIERASGGFRLSGRWSFASGVHHAHWIILGDIVGGDAQDHRLFLMPQSDYRIDDDWHTLGMAGTGSASVVVDNVFVPDHRIVSIRDINIGRAPGTRVNRAPLYRMPLSGFPLLALAAVPVGVALGMVGDFRGFAGRSSGGTPSGMELLHERFAEAAAETRSAELLLIDSARQNSVKLEAGQILDESDAARSVRDGGYSVMLARRAAMRLFEVTGGRGLHLSQPLQRAFRDVLGASAHGSLGWQRNALAYARHALAAKS